MASPKRKRTVSTTYLQEKTPLCDTCGGQHLSARCKIKCPKCRGRHRFIDCIDVCTFDIGTDRPCGSKTHATKDHIKITSQTCRRCKDYHDKWVDALGSQYPLEQSIVDDLPLFYRGHTRPTSKSCCFHRHNLTSMSKNTEITTIGMSLGSFTNNKLNSEERIQLQQRIDDAVLCATVVGQRVLLFLNHYYRHRLENGHPVPEISESLVKVVIDKLVNIKIVGTAHDLSKETFDDLESFFQQHFLPLLEPMKSILKDRPIFDQKGKIIASGNKNPLIYLARSIKAVCENHVVTNIHRRVGKLLTALAITELEACKISRKSYPVRGVVEHLLKTLTEKDPDVPNVCFSLPTWMTDPDSGWKSKLSDSDLNLAYYALICSFERAKRYFLKSVSLTREDVQKGPANYFPLLFAIRRHFEQENDLWNAELDGKTLEEKRVMARADYRGGGLIRTFPLLPEFGNRWQPVTICSATLVEWLGAKKGTEDQQQIYEELWTKNFQLEKVIPKDQTRQTSDRSFHYMIRTDGVWVGVMVNTLRRRRKKRPWHTKEPKILGVDVSTSSRLLATDPKDLLGKIVAVVDPGKKPIMTVGYYRIASDFDKDGKLKYEPHRLTDDQRGQQHKQQRRWRQRNSRRESGKTNKAKMKRPGVPAQITDDTRQRSEPKPTRRSHGHFMQISTKYWKEITGQGKRQRRLRRWERNSGMNDLFIEAQKYPRLCSATEYTKYIKFTQSTMRQRLTFSGQRRVRRLRLDAHIGRKRAEGELCRRFLQPAGTRVDQMVVLWGDGDFKHNMPGSATTPCGRMRDVLCRGIGGRSATGVRPGILPGSEHNTSRRCPTCHGEIRRHVIGGKQVTALSVCQKCSIFCTQQARPMIVERNIAALVHILEGSLSLIESHCLPKHLAPKTKKRDIVTLQYTTT